MDWRRVGAFVELWGKPWQGEQLLRSCSQWLLGGGGCGGLASLVCPEQASAAPGTCWKLEI